MSYDPYADKVVTDRYTMAYYEPGEERLFISDLSVSEAAGGSGKDFADRVKVRSYAKSKLFLSVSFHEEEWDSEVPAYLDGPVRIIRLSRNRLTFLGFEVAPSYEAPITFYRDFCYVPAEIHQTIDIAALAREATAELSIDFNEHARGMRYYRPTADPASSFRTIDGRADPSEEPIDPRRPDWHLVTGEPGTLLWWVEYPEPLQPLVDLRFTDDANEDDGPEDTEGLMGETGYRIDLLPVEKGRYLADIYYAIPSHWKEGDEQGFLAMTRDPLRTTVRAVSPELASTR